MILPNGSIYLTNIITKIDLLNKSIYQTVLDCSNRPFHGAVFYYIFAILIVATLVIRDFNYHPTNQNRQKKVKCVCAKKTRAKNQVLHRRHVWQKVWTSRIECAKNVGGTQKKDLLWKQVLISAEDAKKICHSINRL